MVTWEYTKYVEKEGESKTPSYELKCLALVNTRMYRVYV